MSKPDCAGLDLKSSIERMRAAGLDTIGISINDDLKKLETPFLAKATVYRIIVAHPAGFGHTHVACVDPDAIFLLDRDPKAVSRLLKAAQANLDSPENRLAYLRFYLWVVGRWELLETYAQLQGRFTPNLPGAKKRIATLKKRYEARIYLPSMKGPFPIQTKGYALGFNELLEIKVELKPDGELITTTSRLEKNLPIPQQI